MGISSYEERELEIEIRQMICNIISQTQFNVYFGEDGCEDAYEKEYSGPSMKDIKNHYPDGHHALIQILGDLVDKLGYSSLTLFVEDGEISGGTKSKT